MIVDENETVVNASAATASLKTRLFEYAERHLPALTRLKRVEALPIHLDRHRIYVLPTRFGLMLSALLLVMLLGALNYNNNPALLLTCLFAAAAYQSVFAAFATLNRLEVTALRAEPGHAGSDMEVFMHFHIAARPRRSLRAADAEIDFDLDRDGAPVGLLVSDRDPGAVHVLDIAIAAEHRGRGLGSMVLTGLLEEARASDREVTLLVWAANTGARRLYERLGFGYAEPATDTGHLRMRWRPDPITRDAP